MTYEFEMTINNTTAQYLLTNDKKEYRKKVRELRAQFDIVNVIRTSDEEDMEVYGETAAAIKDQENVDIKDYKYVIECFNR